MPPASGAHEMTPNADIGLGLTLVLGTDYEKKKQKLLQERQLDYKDHMAKKKDLKTFERHLQHQNLSLPIIDRISEKERLREERKKEYNLFLQERAQTGKLKRGTPPVTPKPERLQSDAANVTSQGPPLSFNSPTNIPPPHTEHLASRRDVATLTEAADKGGGRRTWNQSPQRQRRWKIHMPKQPYSSEEMSSDEEEDFDFRHRRRRGRCIPEPEYKEEKRSREHRLNRAFQDVLEMPVKREASAVHEQNHSDSIWKSDKQMPESMKAIVRAESGTGLMIGAIEDRTATQMRKEQYKQELLRQIAEQQRNKMKEKKLELRVAAIGATDPEKESDRIKQPGAAYQRRDSLRRFQVDLEAVVQEPNPRLKDDKPLENPEQRAPPRKPQMDFSSELSHLPRKKAPESGMAAVPGAPPLDYFSGDYHRDFTSVLGEVAFPRFAGVVPPLPPPLPPIVPNTYKTPYDSAYYYYGARNPLDPDPSNQKALPGGEQLSGNFEIPPQQPLPLQANSHDEASSSPVEGLHADKSKWRSQLSYQEALKQQIKEREMLKKREKEEEEHLDAKLKADMMTYSPWGRSGGGAPIKDKNGNIISDLNQMHRVNNNNMFTPEVTARVPFSSPLSRGDDQSSSQRLLTQNRYKEELKQQMEENMRKQAEEREHFRIEEEKEEKRLAKERARLQQEYEEEQKKKMATLNKYQIHEPETHLAAKVKCTKKNKEMTSQSARTRGEKSSHLFYERAPSPPIPTLQKKQIPFMASRPSSVVSQLSSRTERLVSAPHSQPLPARLPPLNKGQREVIRELSALRRYLRREQRQLEFQRGSGDPGEAHPSLPSSRQPRVDASGSVNEEAAHFDNQNIRDFNQLMYRGANCVEAGKEGICQQGSPQSSGEHRERTASRRRLICEEVHDHGDQRQLVSDVTESHDI